MTSKLMVYRFRNWLAYVVSSGPNNCIYSKGLPYASGRHRWSWWPPLSLRKPCKACGDIKGEYQ